MELFLLPRVVSPGLFLQNDLTCNCLQPDAHEEAETELKRLQEMERDESRRREEQLQKAHLRGKQALRREHLEQVQCSRWRTTS